MQMRSSAAALEANINVTPLVDVCLVLLIIFMIVMPAMVNGLPVNLPEQKPGASSGRGSSSRSRSTPTARYTSTESPSAPSRYAPRWNGSIVARRACR